jgi:mannose-1-phosphate guanylyltransferase/mannose-6-phosphate isomerase
MVGVIGLSDVAVVATKDAVLVMPRAQSQEVKTLVAELEGRKRRETESHARVMRPWGYYESIGAGKRFQVKHIVVHSGRALSLQKHFHRAEHWVVVVGTAFVECDGETKHLFENQSIFIPKGSVHRLSNPGKTDLHLVEVQSGEYLGEDDIVRLADSYGRVQKRAGGV